MKIWVLQEYTWDSSPEQVIESMQLFSAQQTAIDELEEQVSYAGGELGDIEDASGQDGPGALCYEGNGVTIRIYSQEVCE